MTTLPPPRDPGRYRIAVVCLGNICRSPVAEVVLTARIADAGLADRVEVTSSGTGTWHLGEAMDARAASTLTAAGYDGSRHAAQKFDPGSLAGLDLVLAMDGSNLADIRGTVADLTGHERPDAGDVALALQLRTGVPRGVPMAIGAGV